MLRVKCSGGVETAVHVFGGRGPPVVFCPANGFPICAYKPLVALFKEHFTCYGIDLRGYGETPSGVGPDTPLFGRDVATVISTLGLQGAFVFGHSVGGAAALLAEVLVPGSFSMIVCYEPILYDRRVVDTLGKDHLMWKGPLTLAAIAARRRRKFPSRQEAKQKYSLRPPFSRFAPEALDAYITHGFRDHPDGGVELKCDPANESAAYMETLGVMPVLWPGVAGIDCPVSILAGSNISASNPTEFIASYIHETITQFKFGSFERLEGLHHLGPFEDPKRVAAIIAAHLARHPGHPDHSSHAATASIPRLKQQSRL